MTKKFDVITIGGATRDIVFKTDVGTIIDNKKDLTQAKLVCFESGAKIKIDKASFSLGGGACNTAVCLSRLGLKTGIIAKTGRDKEAEKIVEDLKEEGIDVSFIDYDKNSVTGFSFIVVNESNQMDHTAFLFRGANDELQVNEPTLSKIKTGWVYVTSISGDNWPLVLRNVTNYVQNSKYRPGTFKKASGTKFVWNPGSVQISAGKRKLENFLNLTDILILNKDEAIELVMSDLKNVKSKAQLKNVEFLLRTIQGWGPNIVAITCGEDGAYVIKNGQVYFEKAKKVKTVDTTGAGDSFGASFIAGLILYKDIKKAMKLGMVNSASVVTAVGAQAGLLKFVEIGTFDKLKF